MNAALLTGFTDGIVKIGGLRMSARLLAALRRERRLLEAIEKQVKRGRRGRAKLEAVRKPSRRLKLPKGEKLEPMPPGGLSVEEILKKQSQLKEASRLKLVRRWLRGRLGRKQPLYETISGVTHVRPGVVAGAAIHEVPAKPLARRFT